MTLVITSLAWLYLYC